MSERALSRRSFTRIGAAALALPALGALQGLAAPHAYANTNNLWSDMDWRMAGYEEARGTMDAARQGSQYQSLVRGLRGLTSQPMAGAQGDPRFLDTTRRASDPSLRVIRILLWNPLGRAHVALYFNVDNLYLMGFSSHGQHFRFDDTSFSHLSQSLARRFGGPAPLVRVMRSTGRYATLSAPAEWRGNQVYTTHNFLFHLSTLETANEHNMNAVDVNRALAFFIGATSEAARFGWIEERVASVIARGYDPADPNHPAHLGAFGTDLQNAWDPMSVMVHRTLQGRSDITPVRIDHRVYNNWQEVSSTSAGPRIAPFIGILGKGI
ncbi:ribosome-inactivating family protein [Streptomyces sp. CC224B]|uniref:ribosome-inactivating family protein n=1 Tax=Streptomyces sp. CC224B TaxID=3044571 RepID=UPI0024A8B0B5|nr:ribosome-inactivating family protein [Streptomyces sp. CC224B]